MKSRKEIVKKNKQVKGGGGEQCLFVVVFLFIVSCDVKATSSRTSMSIVFRIQEKMFLKPPKICVFSETCAWKKIEEFLLETPPTFKLTKLRSSAQFTSWKGENECLLKRVR